MRFGLHGGVAIVGHAADADEQLHYQRIAQRLRARTVVRLALLIVAQAAFQLLALSLSRRQQMPPQPVGGVEAVHDAHVGEDALEILPVEINYHAVVRLTLVDQRLVYRVVLHQQQRPRLQRVYLALDEIVHTSGQQQHDLVELMEVKVALLPRSVAQVEIMIVLAQISLARKSGVFCHASPPAVSLH